jgi:hypothetical protein
MIVSNHIIFFTDWVSGEELKSYYGWSMILFICLQIAFNMKFVIGNSCYTLRLVFIKYKKIAKIKFTRFHEKYFGKES